MGVEEASLITNPPRASVPPTTNDCSEYSPYRETVLGVALLFEELLQTQDFSVFLLLSLFDPLFFSLEAECALLGLLFFSLDLLLMLFSVECALLGLLFFSLEAECTLLGLLFFRREAEGALLGLFLALEGEVEGIAQANGFAASFFLAVVNEILQTVFRDAA